MNQHLAFFVDGPLRGEHRELPGPLPPSYEVALPPSSRRLLNPATVNEPVPIVVAVYRPVDGRRLATPYGFSMQYKFEGVEVR